MFRNPEAHEPKISWNITEQDALEILAMISYCHRRLDNAQKNKIAEKFRYPISLFILPL